MTVARRERTPPVATAGVDPFGIPRGEQDRARPLSLHLLVYLLDDLVPSGPLGYHLALRGVRREATS